MRLILWTLIFLAGCFSHAELGQSYLEAPGVNKDFAKQILQSIQKNIDQYKDTSSTELPNQLWLSAIFGSEVSVEEKEANLQASKTIKFEAERLCESDQKQKSSTSNENGQTSISGQRCKENRAALKEKSMELFARFLKIDKQILNQATDLNMLKVVKTFASRARHEDQNISTDDVLQASRNVWTAAALQKILNVEVRLTDSIFGYSMLYPYTDNVFDDPHLDRKEKRTFVKNFGLLLLERAVPNPTPHEMKVSAMVSAIYNQYSSQSFPNIQQALLSIYHAQVASVKQTAPNISLNEVLETSAFKGATSVLADAYLAKPQLNMQEIDMSIELGFVLQLIDDLQDFTPDMKVEQKTLFSYPGKTPGQLGFEVVRMLKFSLNIMLANLTRMPRQIPLGYSIFGFLRLLAFEAIAKQSEFFTPEFVAQVEARSPIRFQDLRSADIEKHLYEMINNMDFE